MLPEQSFPRCTGCFLVVLALGAPNEATQPRGTRAGSAGVQLQAAQALVQDTASQGLVLLVVCIDDRGVFIITLDFEDFKFICFNVGQEICKLKLELIGVGCLRLDLLPDAEVPIGPAMEVFVVQVGEILSIGAQFS